MEAFEKRVPRSVWGFAQNMGYQQVPQQQKRAWLENHFFLPGGWVECRDVARISSVSRMRKFCWQALVDVVTIDMPTRGQGRPRTRHRKKQTLYYLLHQTAPVPVEWQWPLVTLAIEPTKLQACERLWLAGRPGVLLAEHARLFCIELAVFCAEQTKMALGPIDKACTLIRDAHNAGTFSETSVRNQLRKCLPEHPAMLVFLEAVWRDPTKAVRKTLGQAVQACENLKLQDAQKVFAAMLQPVVLERML